MAVILSLEQAKAALAEVIAAFEEPAAVERIRVAVAVPEEARAMALLPIVQQIQAVVLAKYGFEGPAGVFQGIMALKMHDSDAEVKAGIEKITSGFMQLVKS
ncbi:hypothetical protein T492DRAFT_1094935 [Pavlovales sp. CCMP2436]|nr:hypothetical protein T492DRAFT_1094935 [Pavlovales sp. CCMP2436]